MSHSSESYKVSHIMVQQNTLLGFEELQYSEHVLLLLSVKKIIPQA